MTVMNFIENTATSTTLISLLGMISVAVITWLASKNKNQQDASEKKETVTDKIILRIEKENEILNTSALIKDKIIDNLTIKIIEKDEAEKLYIVEIHELKKSVDILRNDIVKLSLRLEKQTKIKKLPVPVKKATN
jgi:hypothetical protein